MKTIRRTLCFFILSGLGLLGGFDDLACLANGRDMTIKGVDGLSPQLNAYIANEKLMLDIPQSLLGKEMLFVRDRSGQEHISWELHGDKVFLTVKDVHSGSGNLIPANESTSYIRGARLSGIVETFPVLEKKGDGAVTIDITSLFISDYKRFLSSGENIDPKRSYLEGVRVYPGRIEIDAVQTVTGLSDPTPLTVRSHWSLYRLPENPMQVRIFDPRMGFARDKGYRSLPVRPEEASILRWRLEKKSPYAKRSEPVEPIVFYLDPKIPKKWIPYIREGVLEWNKAFNAAGFEKAIRILPAPTDDPGWSVADMGYSVVRWVDNRKKRKKDYPRRSGHGAGGVNKVIDLRTGELLKADLIIGPPFAWPRYVIRAVASDSTLSLPVPDEVLGNLLQDLVTHETGHALGLEDGHYGKYTYPAKLLNSMEWLSIYGHTPSIMNYDRSNYTIQQGDSIPLEMRFQKVGPADIHHIQWGYTVIPDVHAPEDEFPYLDSIVRIQDSIPWLGYIEPGKDNLGPYRYEVISSNDPVYTTKLGIGNLKKVMKWLPENAEKGYGGSHVLELLYFEMLNQWVKEMQHVASLIGGYQVQYKGSNQPGSIYHPIPKEKQQEAVRFLVDNAFNTPLWLVDKRITDRFSNTYTLANISSIQSEVLTEMFGIFKFQRMTEMELTLECGLVYSREAYLSDLNRGVWSELYKEKSKINPYRQELQYNYLLMVKRLLEENEPKIKNHMARFKISPRWGLSVSTRALLLQSLIELKDLMEEAPKSSMDRATKGHLLACSELIKVIVER